MQINSLTQNQNPQLHNTGDNNKVTSQSNSQSSTSTAPAGAASGEDKVSLTKSATQLQTLTEHVKSLPVVDVQEVEDVQRTLATTGLQFEPKQAADNMLDQEKAFAMIEMQG